MKQILPFIALSAIAVLSVFSCQKEPANTTPAPPTPSLVDLGLSVKWATCNLGASKPTEYGGYYQWAGTKDVSDTGIYLDWSNCPYHTGSDNQSGWTKYNTESSYGTVDNKTVLESMDDVASVVLGGKLRIPTDEEWMELRTTDNCSWTWTTIDGVNGYKVQSKKSGYTNNWIFLPAAGYRSYDRLVIVGSYGFYWSSSLGTEGTFNACSMYLSSSLVFRGHRYRCFGQSVRPVCKKEPAQSGPTSFEVPVESIDLSLPELSANGYVEITKGDILEVVAAVHPDNATDTLTWEIQYNDVAIVVYDDKEPQNHKVSIMGTNTGTTTITVSASGVEESFRVFVKEPYIPLKAIVLDVDEITITDQESVAVGYSFIPENASDTQD